MIFLIAFWIKLESEGKSVAASIIKFLPKNIYWLFDKNPSNHFT